MWSRSIRPVISASLAMDLDPRPLTPHERAATLLFASHALYQDIITAKLPPDLTRTGTGDGPISKFVCDKYRRIEQVAGYLTVITTSLLSWSLTIVFLCWKFGTETRPLSIRETADILEAIAKYARDENSGEEFQFPSDNHCSS